jgi:hypothetical protein
MTNEGLVKEQRTFLWGTASATSKPSFLCHDDKMPLSSYEICEWLCSLPRKFGKANFIGFSISYDVTQILGGLPYEKAWQIVKQLPFSENENPTGLKPNRWKVFWDKFAISHVPRQYFSIGILRDPDHPYKRDKDGKVKYPRQIDYEPGTLITIDDVFGFYQSPFVKAAERRTCGRSRTGDYQGRQGEAR